MSVFRFEVYRVNLEPIKGREMNKVRPCVVVSPDEINRFSTVIIAPLTSQGFELPMRVPCQVNGQHGLILLDHLRAVDKLRLGERLGVVDIETQQEICEKLQSMFAY